MEDIEYLDILDEKGNMTGKTASHEEAHEKGLWHKTAHVWIVNLQNEILLQHRAKNKAVYPDMWDISAAGHVSSGEDIDTAALRETKEELGVDINPSQLKMIGEMHTMNVHQNGKLLDNEYTNIYLIRGDFNINDFVMAGDEVQNLKFVKIPEFKEAVEKKTQDIVPHPEEYEILFKALENL